MPNFQFFGPKVTKIEKIEKILLAMGVIPGYLALVKKSARTGQNCGKKLFKCTTTLIGFVFVIRRLIACYGAAQRKKINSLAIYFTFS